MPLRSRQAPRGVYRKGFFMLPRTRCARSEAAAAAVDFLHRGFCPIAVNPKTKKAAREWKRFQTERPTEQEVVRMFDGVDDPGIALITGPVSDGLYVHDFDSPDSYDAWAKAYPALSQGFLPTVRTARGHHVWVRSREVVGCKQYPKKFGTSDGDFKGLGGYALVPPTKPYRFLYPLKNEVPLLSIADTGLARPWLISSGAQSASETQEIYSRYIPSCVSLGAPGFADGTTEAIVRLGLEATIPAGVGVRHQKIFELIRILKASPQLAQRPAEDLEPYFREWHNRALDRIGTKDWSVSWSEFKSGWKLARSAAFDDPRVAIQIARSSPLPLCAARYDVPAMRDLVGLCNVMQKFHGDSSFFLGCRMAGEVLGLSRTRAHRYICKLQHDGLLIVTNKHDLAARSATGKRMAWEYRFLGGESSTRTSAESLTLALAA